MFTIAVVHKHPCAVNVYEIALNRMIEYHLMTPLFFWSTMCLGGGGGGRGRRLCGGAKVVHSPWHEQLQLLYFQYSLLLVSAVSIDAQVYRLRVCLWLCT